MTTVTIFTDAAADNVAEIANVFNNPKLEKLEKQDVLRFKFDSNFIAELTNFAKIHQYDNREDYKEAWTEWCENNSDIVSRETNRLQQLGYTGDVNDKMYKSSRYYFRTKSLAPCTPIKRRKYMSIGADMLETIDAHIIKYLTSVGTDKKCTPAGGFTLFQENYQELIQKTVDMLTGNDKEEDGEHGENGGEDGGEDGGEKLAMLPKKDAEQKIKKTYKNRYFVAVKRNKKFE